MLLFNLITFVNIFLIIFILRWRHVFSAEGLGMLFLLLIILSDYIGIIVVNFYGLSGFNLPFEIQLRILPGIYTIIALLAFIVGLGFGCNKIKKRSSNTLINKKKIVLVANVLIVFGYISQFIALYSWGFRSLSDYYSGLYVYQATKQGGGFLDAGLSFVLIGFSLLISIAKSNLRIVLYFFGLILSSFILSPSKSGIHIAMIVLIFVLRYYSYKRYRIIFNPIFIIFMIVFIFIGIGVKTQLKYHYNEMNLSQIFEDKGFIFYTAYATIGRRYGPFGLYRQNCFLINRIHDNSNLLFRGRVLFNTITGWVPRYVWSNKPEHPFHARGDLVNEDYVSDEYSNDAPTFVGYAYSDYGVISILLYMFLGGLILGLIRRLLYIYKHSTYLTVSYIFFSIITGVALSESGFLNLFYNIVFSFAFFLLIFFCSLALNQRSNAFNQNIK